MADNALTKVARIAARATQGLVYKDSTGKEQTILPTGDKNMIDISGLSISNGSGGDTGGGDNPDHPSAGADYYAGSLADGEITERYLLYQRDETVAEQIGSQTVTLLRDVGSTFNMAGDGATFLIHLVKTVMTKGTKGAVTDIELNYDPNNVARDGYFTTTSPYPIYIKGSDLATKKTLSVPINGIGENLSGKNFLAPHLHVKFNGDGTMTYSSVTGYDNDGNTAGATGASYDVIVDVIATFSTQKAVAQIPAPVNFFTGSATGNIVLSGISDFYENSMDGIEITFDYLFGTTFNRSAKGRFPVSELGLTKTLRIPKCKLINGYKFTLPVKKISSGTKLNNVQEYYTRWIDPHNRYFFLKYLNNSIQIGKNSMNISLEIQASNRPTSYNDVEYALHVLKITPYKN